ncbi:MAG: rplS [Patescibacteria group bacterium]|nr:rplS [Patescibacteria group bacterium]
MVKSGDTVRVHQRIKEGAKERVQIFEGLVIAVKHGTGLNGSFTVRKIAAGSVGVEKTYPLHSPNVVKVERIKVAEVNRAKLYYMRDRRGKSARFKVEGPSYETWDESAAKLAAEEKARMEAEIAAQEAAKLEAEEKAEAEAAAAEAEAVATVPEAEEAKDEEASA